MMRAMTLVALVGCATTATSTPKGGPRGLRASDHVEIAQRHAEMAHDRAVMPARFDAPDGNGVVWLRTWEPNIDHERIAQEHRSKAAGLHADYQNACGDRPLAEVSMSPLQRYAIGGWPTSTGIIMYLQPIAGGPDKLLSDLECHRAWMMLAPSGMDDCPLDLPDIVLDARGDADGITVSIVVRDPKLVDELHRRAAHDLEVGAQFRLNAKQ